MPRRFGYHRLVANGFTTGPVICSSIGNSMQAVWIAVGSTALFLGVIGLALPLVPTTPFILLAAFAFARSSDRWHGWLLRHRVFGPIIENWRLHGAVGSRAKIASVLAMAGVLGLSAALNASVAVLAVQAVVLSAAAAFVLSRPSPPGQQ